MKRYLRGFVKVLDGFFRVSERDKIPRAPRLMGTDFQTYERDVARVMSRLGIRSPDGLRHALNKYGAANVEELVSKLPHYRPEVRIYGRVRRWVQSWARLYQSPPRGERRRRRAEVEREQFLKAVRLFVREDKGQKS